MRTERKEQKERRERDREEKRINERLTQKPYECRHASERARTRDGRKDRFAHLALTWFLSRPDSTHSSFFAEREAASIDCKIRSG